MKSQILNKNIILQLIFIKSFSVQSYQLGGTSDEEAEDEEGKGQDGKQYIDVGSMVPPREQRDYPERPFKDKPSAMNAENYAAMFGNDKNGPNKAPNTFSTGSYVLPRNMPIPYNSQNQAVLRHMPKPYNPQNNPWLNQNLPVIASVEKLGEVFTGMPNGYDPNKPSELSRGYNNNNFRAGILYPNVPNINVARSFGTQNYGRYDQGTHNMNIRQRYPFKAMANADNQKGRSRTNFNPIANTNQQAVVKQNQFVSQRNSALKETYNNQNLTSEEHRKKLEYIEDLIAPPSDSVNSIIYLKNDPNHPISIKNGVVHGGTLMTAEKVKDDFMNSNVPKSQFLGNEIKADQDKDNNLRQDNSDLGPNSNDEYDYEDDTPQSNVTNQTINVRKYGEVTQTYFKYKQNQAMNRNFYNPNQNVRQTYSYNPNFQPTVYPNQHTYKQTQYNHGKNMYNPNIHNQANFYKYNNNISSKSQGMANWKQGGKIQRNQLSQRVLPQSKLTGNTNKRIARQKNQNHRESINPTNNENSNPSNSPNQDQNQVPENPENQMNITPESPEPSENPISENQLPGNEYPANNKIIKNSNQTQGPSNQHEANASVLEPNPEIQNQQQIQVPNENPDPSNVLIPNEQQPSQDNHNYSKNQQQQQQQKSPGDQSPSQDQQNQTLDAEGPSQIPNNQSLPIIETDKSHDQNIQAQAPEIHTEEQNQNPPNPENQNKPNLIQNPIPENNTNAPNQTVDNKNKETPTPSKVEETIIIENVNETINQKSPTENSQASQNLTPGDNQRNDVPNQGSKTQNIADPNYIDIPGWDDIGIETIKVNTDKGIKEVEHVTLPVPTEMEFEITTPEPDSEVVLAAKKTMVDHNMGYFLGFTHELFQLIKDKTHEDAQELITATQTVIDNMVDSGALADMGDAAKGLHNVVDAVAALPAEKIQANLKYGQFRLINRGLSFIPEVALILNIIDSAYNIQQGEALLKTLNSVDRYPMENKTAIEVAKETVDAVMLAYWTAPFANRAKLFQMINDVIVTYNKGAVAGRRFIGNRRGEIHDKANKATKTSNKIKNAKDSIEITKTRFKSKNNNMERTMKTKITQNSTTKKGKKKTNLKTVATSNIAYDRLKQEFYNYEKKLKAKTKINIRDKMKVELNKLDKTNLNDVTMKHVIKEQITLKTTTKSEYDQYIDEIYKMYGDETKEIYQNDEEISKEIYFADNFDAEVKNRVIKPEETRKLIEGTIAEYNDAKLFKNRKKFADNKRTTETYYNHATRKREEDEMIKTKLKNIIKKSTFNLSNLRRTFDNAMDFRRNIEEAKSSDEEMVIKRNIYKVFGYGTDFKRLLE